MTRAKEQRAAIEWYRRLVAAAAALPPDALKRLREWEAEHVDGSGRFGTGDWPEWPDFIGQGGT